jgi:hypothetical protein
MPTDEEAIAKLKVDVQQHSKTMDPSTLLCAGTYFWLTNKHSNAKQCLERILSDFPNDISALTVLGWVELTGGSVGSKHEKKALAYFEQALGIEDDAPAPGDSGCVGVCVQGDMLTCHLVRLCTTSFSTA